MDFTSELVAFQGALISANEIHKLQSLTTGGGNENKIKYVIDSVKKFMVAEKYITEEGLVTSMIPKIRKIAFYIILNTDMISLLGMTALVELNPLIFSAPMISKHLMCELMWQLHMEPLIYELIPKVWPYLGSEIAEAFLENFKYFNPMCGLERLGDLSQACYLLLCRIVYYKSEFLAIDTLSISNTFQKLLKYYVNPPKKHLLNGLSTDDVYKYKAKRFKNILKLVYNCVNMFTTNLNPTGDDPIYRLTYIADCIQNRDIKVCESPCERISAYLVTSNLFMMDIFQEVVMDVNIEMFCAWSEFEDDGKNMQQVIGEMCDKVLSSLRRIDILSEHPVLNHISIMARKPIDINEVINSTDLATILEKINNNNEESQLWLHALVFKEPFHDISLLNAVNENINIYNSEECFKLYKKVNTIAVNSTNEDVLTRTSIKLFHRCDVTNKHELLKERFRDKTFINARVNVLYLRAEMHSVFNKFIADINVDYTDVLTFFYQMPKKTFIHIFAVVIQNPRLMEPMVNLMIFLKDYKDYCFDEDKEPCLISVLKILLNNKLLPYSHLPNLVKFISQLKCKEILTGSQLLMMLIMPSLHEALVPQDAKIINAHVQLLIEAFVIEELIPYRAPMFVMLAQMMEVLRPRTYETFQQDALNVLNTVISFQKALIETHKQNVIPNKEKIWLKEKIKLLKPCSVNLYYFRYFWVEEQRNLFNFTTRAHIVNEAVIKAIASKLMPLLPYAAMSEWCALWHCCINGGGMTDKDVLRVYHTVVLDVIRQIETNRTPSSVSCILYCMRNFIHMIKYYFLKEPLTNDQVKLCCKLLARTLGPTNRLDAAEIDSMLVPLFSYLAQRKADYTAYLILYFIDTHYIETARKILPKFDLNVERV